MREINVGENEAGQRIDRVVSRYLKKAPQSFIYKMLRKKNITLNGRKAGGGTRLEKGDVIRIFLSEETIASFSEDGSGNAAGGRCEKAQGRGKFPEEVKILYEDADLIFFDKPAGVLSQKASDGDYSLCEYLIDYMVGSGSLTKDDLLTFKPSVCNRLDRNTSGVVAAGKSLGGLRGLNLLFRDRSFGKYYRAVVTGVMTEAVEAGGWILKDQRSNQAEICTEKKDGALPILTKYTPLESFELEGAAYTYLEIKLETGRGHQIRAQLKSLGHPIAGDPKYGDSAANSFMSRRYGIHRQLLHSYRMEFPQLDGALSGISKREITAPLPDAFKKILDDGVRL